MRVAIALLLLCALSFSQGTLFPSSPYNLEVKEKSFAARLPNGSRIAVALPVQVSRQDTLLHWPQYTETVDPQKEDLSVFAHLVQAQLQSTLPNRLNRVETFPIENSLCKLASDYTPTNDSISAIPQPSDSCLAYLQAQQAKYFLYVSALVVDRSPCPHQNGCKMGEFEEVLPRVRMQLSLYDVQARKPLQTLKASQLFSTNRLQHKMTLLDFYQRTFAALPLENNLASAYRQAKCNSHEAIELSWGQWNSSTKGDFWELRYVQGNWNTSLSLASLDIASIYENRALSLVGWWNPILTQSGWRFGLHAGPNLNIATSDTLLDSKKRSYGMGYEFGTHIDYVIGLGLTAGLRFGYSSRTIEFGQADYSFQSPYANFSIGWGPRWDWFR